VEIQARRFENPLNLNEIAESATERFINRESFANQPPLLAISVTDTAGGIEPAIVEKMFREKFTTKPPDKGTGLGLSIVRRLAEEARGGIHLRTRLGEGSTFTLIVKLRESARGE
jgi:signal transduction histidine kinase